jgi:hypothetical protein
MASHDGSIWVSCGTIWHFSDEIRWSGATRWKALGRSVMPARTGGTQCAPPPLHRFPAAIRHLGRVAPLGVQQPALAARPALQTLFKPAEVAEKHRVASFQDESLRRRLEFLLTFDQDLRDLAAELLQGAGRRGRGLADSSGWATMWRITMSKTAYRGRASSGLDSWIRRILPDGSPSRARVVLLALVPAECPARQRQPQDIKRNGIPRISNGMSPIPPRRPSRRSCSAHLSQSHK